ncbi:NADP-dependent phosphogluconate dehydrogenase [Flavivirga rizhaonensis]|uniref:6-phosphogluconate dehydrogenase, decarboxylating n=1 Tax=Flavivirga rizhaonensis TaxID=2559571 RepID=A0A4S1DTI7_9FLAO|nr:NADP-dependent phosphogluconate dehydrogenase [Flavivirga rizhaonensis]TGV01297.1 NADP-dependent phosphogluconate dehydrogenase [Flavivirga rizhaonensis]
MIIVLLGVSGCGKTTVGKQLSQKTGIPFFDGDDFHPKSNIDKMTKGMSLNDNDRCPWLLSLASNIETWAEENGAILACSALKERYRVVLSSKYNDIIWVHLSGSHDLIKGRIEKRGGHFMNADLLASQFKDLETPEYGIHADISESPEKITENIISKLENINQSFFGVIGLGVMGSSLSLNIAEKGYALSVYNRIAPGEENIVSDFLNKADEVMQIKGFTELKAFVNSLERPRKILIMIKAGKAIDAVIEALIPILSEGDILIDGGNSHYLDTNKRYEYLKSKQLHFIGCGVSGGEEGARKGPSIMPGGAKESYQIIEPVLEAIAAKDKKGNACCAYVGLQGAGHFVKMVHNGIEYAEMQLLAEIYALLSITNNNEEITTILSQWNTTDLSSYLLEITINILKTKENGKYVLDTILDKAGNKGTGSWSTKAGFDLGTVNTMMSSAVFARYISSFKEKRKHLSKFIKSDLKVTDVFDVNSLEKAYRFARIINHHQGFELIRLASKTFNWQLNISEIARIWTNGCIIRSEFMETSVNVFKDYESYLDTTDLLEVLISAENHMTKSIAYSLSHRVPFDTFWSAYNHWIAITTENLPANLIQAQRDYFGAHMYQKIDAPKEQFFHTNWY